MWHHTSFLLFIGIAPHAIHKSLYALYTNVLATIRRREWTEENSGGGGVKHFVLLGKRVLNNILQTVSLIVSDVSILSGIFIVHIA